MYVRASSTIAYVASFLYIHTNISLVFEFVSLLGPCHVFNPNISHNKLARNNSNAISLSLEVLESLVGVELESRAAESLRVFRRETGDEDVTWKRWKRLF